MGTRHENHLSHRRVLGGEFGWGHLWYGFPITPVLRSMARLIPMFHSSHKGYTPSLAIHFGSADATRFTQGQSQWSPVLNGCGITHTDEFRWSIMINFISDFVLLGIMILGVLQKRNATYLWNMLYFQALFWILAATMTELPSVVCLSCSRGVSPRRLIGYLYPGIVF
jgi:hypothetical protein